MHSHRRALILSPLLIVVVAMFDVSAQGGRQGTQQPGQQAGPQMRRDAREDAPEALIGSWVQNLEKSHYDPGPPLKSQTRTFDYTHDGLILCNYTQVSAQGNRSVGHWAVTLDGREWPEYTRNNGATVFALVGIKKTDDYNMEITVRRFGRLVQNGLWTLSKDGKSLTQVLKTINPQGQVTSTNVAVFEKQE